VLSEELYNQIFNNFGQQQELYVKMSDWSRQELDLLEQDDWDGDRLNNLLEERQGIINEIDALGRLNKQLQEQVTLNLGLGEFMLSSLESHLKSQQFQALQELLRDLGQLLVHISEMDQQSHLLIKKRIESRKNASKSENRLVQNAYREAMQQAKRFDEF